jgi:hypothetical protein
VHAICSVSWADENATFGEGHKCLQCQPLPERERERVEEVSDFDSVQPVLQAEASSLSFIDQRGFFLFRGKKKPSKRH